MPKKRYQFLSQLQGSTSSRPAANQGDGDNKPSVNERLSELRKLEGKDAAAKKRLMAELVNQRSVPPDVLSILGVPESASPKPRIAVRARDRMRTPGPAPPKSWLLGSNAWTNTLAMRGGRRIKANANVQKRDRPKQLQRFALLVGLDDSTAACEPLSLLHLSLKAIAESWSYFDEEDYPALSEVPLRIRLKLLSYISYYGTPLTSRQLQAVLQGGESVQTLDLGGLVGHLDLTLKRLGRLIENGEGNKTHSRAESVADSWDAEVSADTALQFSPSLSRFSTLKYLSLSHPGPAATWRDLLNMVKLAPQVTHLSLAYWPRPTLTPNLATSTVTSRHSPDVTAGGSNFYSTLDNDMAEPAALLRQLSAQLLYLQWLDLEGCHDWFPALGKLSQLRSDLVSADIVAPAPRSEWTAASSTGNSIFGSNWKNLRYIRCSQGWLPSLVGLESLPAIPSSLQDESSMSRSIRQDITRYLQDTAEDVRPIALPLNDVLDVERKKARLWLDAECRITYHSVCINRVRQVEGCKLIDMDCGWVKRHDLR